MENQTKNADNEPKLLWIIGTCCSADDGVYLCQFTGTKIETKQKIVDMILRDKEYNIDEYDYGDESIDDITESIDDQLNGYAVYFDCHIDYTAKPLKQITNLNDKGENADGKDLQTLR